MGIFVEDERIRVSNLIGLWVSEGFLKPEKDKSLETIGRGFLKDLIDRNLILIDELGCTGNIKYCKMHDLLRDLCLKEGEKERFYHVIGEHSPQGIDNRRHVFYPQRSSTWRVFYPGSLNERVKSMSHVRSLTSQYDSVGGVLQFRLLRILNAKLCEYRLDAVIHEFVNSRYLAFDVKYFKAELPSSVNLLWNLHTLRLSGKIFIPVEIWKMSQLRHVYMHFGAVCLPDPPCGNNGSSVILENLETLQEVENFKLGEEVVNRIPNIKKLSILYTNFPENWAYDDYYCLRNVERLCKLESFSIFGVRVDFLQSLTFPNTLKKLALNGSSSGCEEMLKKIGSLPLLQKLVLTNGWFTTGKWETVEGQFPNLKFLRLSGCWGLKEWIIEESSHFPCLEKLHLHKLEQLKEIPAEIGNIPTLQSIELRSCRKSAVKSAKKIVEEQEESQDELSFHVRVVLETKKHESLLSLASPNFMVRYA